ncbi:MAG: GyrI-like domain-containing protein [Anaerolineaceae bacterium]|nr:GyrI-like domain-containing protein [Anaerolineaceae bacterium]
MQQKNLELGKELGLELIEIAKAEHYAGISRKASQADHFSVAQELTYAFVEAQGKICHRSSPQVSITMTGTKNLEGKFDYFIGEKVQYSSQDASLNVFTLQPGLYAQLRLKKNPSWLLGFRLARVRKTFYTQFLPNSPYEKAESFDEVEYYGYDSRLKPKRAQTMTLLIPLKAKPKPLDG